MTQVAAECARELAKLPPHQRRREIVRITTISAAAKEIITGQKAAA